MSLADTRGAQLFPVLTGQQIQQAARFASGPLRRYVAGETVFATGQRDTPAFLVMAGELIVTGADHGAAQALNINYRPGQISGELSQLAGRPSLMNGQAGASGCEVLPFDAP